MLLSLLVMLGWLMGGEGEATVNGGYATLMGGHTTVWVAYPTVINGQTTVIGGYPTDKLVCADWMRVYAD
ncbi:hypothetical protein AA0X95_18560 [Bacillus sp. 1P10SD]|uniref:hypothetical protein n=1 Tax=Bacillus sp. 1P10SD TaxID=3132265 RepID=UPI0039A616DC